MDGMKDADGGIDLPGSFGGMHLLITSANGRRLLLGMWFCIGWIVYIMFRNGIEVLRETFNFVILARLNELKRVFNHWITLLIDKFEFSLRGGLKAALEDLLYQWDENLTGWGEIL
jgi:hypothetical protein